MGACISCVFIEVTSVGKIIVLQNKLDVQAINKEYIFDIFRSSASNFIQAKQIHRILF